MPKPNEQLYEGFRHQYIALTDVHEELHAFGDSLLQYGGILPNCKKYVVPAIALPVALGKTSEQLLDELPPPGFQPSLTRFIAKRSRARASSSHLGLLAQAALAALTSNDAEAIVAHSYALSRSSSDPPAFNSHTAYRSLLLQARDITGAPLPPDVRASCPCASPCML